jgi:ribonuclease HI
MKTTDIRSLVVVVDGGCLNNGNLNKSGNVRAYNSFACIANDEVVHIEHDCFLLLDAHTSNQAEYSALYNGLVYINSLAHKGYKLNWLIKSDSELVCNQMLGKAKAKNSMLSHMRGLCREVLQDIFATGSVVKLMQVPREEVVPILGH